MTPNSPGIYQETFSLLASKHSECWFPCRMAEDACGSEPLCGEGLEICFGFAKDIRDARPEP